MINIAIFNPDPHPFNEFTTRLKYFCEKRRKVLVKLRNETWVPVYWGHPDNEAPHFYCLDGDLSFIWENDGSSITSDDFDLIEFEY